MKVMSRIFRIIEARCPDTNILEKRKVYTTDLHYMQRGVRAIYEFKKLYNVTVTTYKSCEEDVVQYLKEKENG